MKPCKLKITINNEVYEYNIVDSDSLENIRKSSWVNGKDLVREDLFSYGKPIFSDKLVIDYSLERYPSFYSSHKELEIYFDFNFMSDDIVKVEFIYGKEVVTSEILYSEMYYVLSKHNKGFIWLVCNGNMHPYSCKYYILDADPNKDMVVQYRKIFAENEYGKMTAGSMHIIIKLDTKDR